MSTIKDILGTTVEVGSTVITCHNGRIIVGRIVELFEQSYNVKIEPLPFDTDGRRDIPRMKPFRRADYNVFVIGDQEMFMGALKGYCHNSGYWDDDYEEE